MPDHDDVRGGQLAPGDRGALRRQGCGKRRAVHGALTGAVALALTVGLMVSASADELTDRRDDVQQQLAQTRAQLNESTTQLTAAAVAVDRAQIKLDSARARLAQTRAALAAAHARDVQMAAKLKRTRAQLTAAKAAVVAGQKRLDAQLARAGDMVRDQYQQQTNLLSIAMLVEGESTADLQTKLQWSTTMFDTTSSEIDRLETLQRQLTAERARVAALERSVAAQRQAAAVNLNEKQTLEQEAAAQEIEVAASLTEQVAAQEAAAAEVAADKQRYAELNRERQAVERRIALRVAEAKAAAARRAAAEAQRIAEAKAAVAREKERLAAAEERAANRSAAAARRATQARQEARAAAREARAARRRADSGASSSSSYSSRTSSSRTAAANHGFSYPVRAPITSPYGPRLHPVLGYWKLHDGTDFGAGCGTPLRAPHAGRVAERYYNAGYGNRLMLDHGLVDGRYVTTGYNHAIRYTVQVGERVRKGEVIGYVGTTGYSTGCHLHLMVWLDGGRINPMTWF